MSFAATGTGVRLSLRMERSTSSAVSVLHRRKTSFGGSARRTSSSGASDSLLLLVPQSLRVSKKTAPSPSLAATETENPETTEKKTTPMPGPARSRSLWAFGR
jgi:hypothetical protein